jgi:hypothetical protein
VTERNETDDLLDVRQFVSLVVSSVRNPALEGTFDALRQPPGRKPAADLLQLAQWFRGLPEADRRMSDQSILALVCPSGSGSTPSLSTAAEGCSTIQVAPIRNYMACTRMQLPMPGFPSNRGATSIW